MDWFDSECLLIGTALSNELTNKGNYGQSTSCSLGLYVCLLTRNRFLTRACQGGNLLAQTLGRSSNKEMNWPGMTDSIINLAPVVAIAGGCLLLLRMIVLVTNPWHPLSINTFH